MENLIVVGEDSSLDLLEVVELVRIGRVWVEEGGADMHKTERRISSVQIHNTYSKRNWLQVEKWWNRKAVKGQDVSINDHLELPIPSSVSNNFSPPLRRKVVRSKLHETSGNGCSLADIRWIKIR